MMAWTTPATFTVGELVTHTKLNTQVRDNFLFLSTHGHSGSVGDGSTTLGNLVKAIFTDAAAPAAPSASLSQFYSVSGTLHFRTNGGADLAIDNTSHAHT